MAITSGATAPGLERWCKGEIAWLASGGSTMYAVLITSASNIGEADDLRSDYTGEATGTDIDIALTLADAADDQANDQVECDATDAPLTFSAVTTSQTVSGFTTCKQLGGSPATSDPVILFNGFSTGNLSTTGVDVEVTLNAEGIVKFGYTPPSAA